MNSMRSLPKLVTYDVDNLRNEVPKLSQQQLQEYHLQYQQMQQANSEYYNINANEYFDLEEQDNDVSEYILAEGFPLKSVNKQLKEGLIPLTDIQNAFNS